MVRAVSREGPVQAGPTATPTGGMPRELVRAR